MNESNTDNRRDGIDAAIGHYRPAEGNRLVLEVTVTDRYYVTEEALVDLYPEIPAQDRDDALIELFEDLSGSQRLDRFFYHDANPQVAVEISEEAKDA